MYALDHCHQVKPSFQHGCWNPVTGMCSSARHPWLLDCGNPCRNDALDTNTVIYFFKNMGNVAKHLFSLLPHEIALPSVVLYELEVF